MRCKGGYYTDLSQLAYPHSPGWWRSACPSCGRKIAFHWATGRFRAHNAPDVTPTLDLFVAGVFMALIDRIRAQEPVAPSPPPTTEPAPEENNDG